MHADPALLRGHFPSLEGRPSHPLLLFSPSFSYFLNSYHVLSWMDAKMLRTKDTGLALKWPETQ